MKEFHSYSAAIRYGATLRPQAFGAYVRPDGSTCTMGAGLHALLGRELTPAECLSKDRLWQLLEDAKLLQRFGYLYSKVDAPCGCEAPAGHHDWNGQLNTSKTIFNLIVHLNNFHRWTREAVAAWLQSEEDKLGYVTISEEVSEFSLVTV